MSYPTLVYKDTVLFGSQAICSYLAKEEISKINQFENILNIEEFRLKLILSKITDNQLVDSKSGIKIYLYYYNKKKMMNS